MKTKLHYLLCVFILYIFSAQAGIREICVPEPSYNSTSFEGIIDGFILVDAETNEDLYELRGGLEIDFDQIKGRKLSIRLKPIPGAFTGTIQRVDFRLDGPINMVRSEFVIPYALFGDIGGNYNGIAFEEGDYTIWVGVDDDISNPHYWDELTLNFSVGKVVHNIAAFHLINPEFDFISWKVQDGTSINFVNNPMSFEARPGTYKVGSVVLELSGPISYSATENFAPFTLFGDAGGDFSGKILPEGDYTLTATPYSETHERGKAGIPLTIHFKIEFDKESLALSSFMSMVDASSGENLETIFVFDQKTIDKKDTPANNVNFIVIPNTSAIKSVYMALQGPVDSFEKFVQPSHIQVENFAPHAMFGDINGVLNGKSLGVGMYRLTATPYSGENGTGNAGFARRFEFEVIDTSSFLKSPVVTGQGPAISLYPNPSNSLTKLKVKEGEVVKKAILMDIFGQQVRDYPGSAASEQSLDVSGLAKGLYFVRIITATGEVTKKLVVH
ncbi:MAG TPA: T9SS type A sorting domain-containing protein [Eudoraea sp.]|nr:T9SS type A sorting domain-containing protein [Eudoraea sp.]